MKKLKYLLLFFMVFSLTGCIKYNATMDIKEDKSMDFSVVYAMDKSVLEMSDDKTILSEEDKQNLINNGFTVEDYSEEKMVGFRISKVISNIDDVSSEGDVEYSLSNIMETGTDQTRMFKVEKGNDKNTYKANFIFDANDSSLSGDENGTPEVSEGVTIEEDESDFGSDEDFDKLGSAVAASMDLKFIVKLPDGAISSNATSKSDDGKELTWDLSAQNKENISFEFSLLNKKTDTTTVGPELVSSKSDGSNSNMLYIIGGIVAFVVLALVIVVLIIVNNSNKKKAVVNSEMNVMSSTNEEENSIVQDVKVEEPVKEAELVTSTETVTENVIEKPQVFEEEKKEESGVSKEEDRLATEEVEEESQIFDSTDKEEVKEEVSVPVEEEVKEEESVPVEEEKPVEEVEEESQIFDSTDKEEVKEEVSVPVEEEVKEEPQIFDSTDKEEVKEEKKEEKKFDSSEIFPSDDNI